MFAIIFDYIGIDAFLQSLKAKKHLNFAFSLKFCTRYAWKMLVETCKAKNCAL